MVLYALLFAPAVVIVVFVVYVVALRTHHHYRSTLTCPRCGGTFEYDWVPLVSFSAVRLGSDRYLQCPLCKQWSTFDIKSTRTSISGPKPAGQSD